MRRTPGDVEVDRKLALDAVRHLRVIEVGAARNGAGADRDHELRRRNRLVGLAQGQPHVLREGAGDQQAVGVAGRRDELDPEAAQVPGHRVQHVHVELAGVAAAGAHLAQLERAAEELAQSPLNYPAHPIRINLMR